MIPVIRRFRLSQSGSAHGVSCDSSGVFIGGIALLEHDTRNGSSAWRPRGIEILNSELGKRFGLPLDLSTKSKALNSIAIALNKGDVARAQLVTLHMEIPEPPSRADLAHRSNETILNSAGALAASQLLKADWDPDEHPRRPAGASDSQGGQFAPKGEGGAGSTETDDGSSKTNVGDSWTSGQLDNSQSPSEHADAATDSNTLEPAVAHGPDDAMFDPVVWRGEFHDQVVDAYLQYLRGLGIPAEKELRVRMADGSAGTRVDVLARVAGVTVGVEVKTGDAPFFTMPQLLVYPHMFWGESVVSPDPKIATFGFPPGQLLPPIPIILLYQKDENSRPDFEELDPKAMLDRYYRLFRRLRRKR